MKVPVGDIPQVITEYADACILPAAAKLGGATPFVVSLVAGLVARNAPLVIQQYTPLLKSIGLMDNENRVDADVLYEEAVKALEKNPVTIGGYRPDRGDLDTLLEIMKRHGG